MTAEIGAVENQQHGVGLGCILHLTLQHVVGDLLVFRAWIEAINSGEIDDDDVVAGGGLGAADPLLDGDAGEVRDFLAQTGEAIEQCRFTGVRRTDDGHHMRARCLREFWWRRRYGTASAIVAIAHGFRAFPAVLEGVRKIKRDAVSRRSATSDPST